MMVLWYLQAKIIVCISTDVSELIENDDSHDFTFNNDYSPFVVNSDTSWMLQNICTKFTYKLSVLIVDLNLVCRTSFCDYDISGEFGVMEGQFTEPSGVAVNAQNDIIVADTNNHRIQIFDKEGRFKFQFGECGKRDGQLLYPNRLYLRFRRIQPTQI
jgi:hypothetical protein